MVDTQSLLHAPLFIPCLVLAALLLLTLLGFTTALLRLRKRSGKEQPQGCEGCRGAMPSSRIPSTPSVPAALTVCPPGPVLVSNSTQGPDAPSGICKNYREMPPSLPKEPGGSGGRLPRYPLLTPVGPHQPRLAPQPPRP